MRALPPQRGFTLAETLTTLAIAGIGLSLALPSLSSLAGNNYQAASVNQMVATMHMARSAAITRNARVTVCASRGGENCEDHPWEQGWIAFVDSDANSKRDMDEPLINQVPSLTGVQLHSAEFASAFSYRPNGRVMGNSPDTNTGEFSFCQTGAETAARIVTVRSNGLPVLSDRAHDGRIVACKSS